MKFESIVKITTGVGLALLAGMATIQTVKEYRTKLEEIWQSYNKNAEKISSYAGSSGYEKDIQELKSKREKSINAFGLGGQVGRHEQKQILESNYSEARGIDDSV